MAISESALKTMWAKSIATFETMRYAASVNATTPFKSNLVQLDTDMDSLIVPDTTQFVNVKQGMTSIRSAMVNLLSGAGGAFQAFVREYGQVLNLAPTDFSALWSELFRNYAENAKTVQSRGIVFATPTLTPVNSSNGSMVLLNVDQFAQVMEAQWMDAKIARCVRDTGMGTAVAEEQWSVEAAAPAKDALQELGSGKVKSSPVVGISSRNTTKFGIQNPSFSTVGTGGAATPSDLGGWNSTIAVSGTNYQFISGSYRAFQGDSTPYYLRCFANSWKIFQLLAGPNQQAQGFDANSAYYIHVAVKRHASADGTLVFRLGAASYSLGVSALTNDVWTIVTIGDVRNASASASTKSQAWYKNFASVNASLTDIGGTVYTGLLLSVEYSGGTTGQVDVDDVSCDVFDAFDGGLITYVGGPIPAQYEDKFTWQHAEYGASVNQKSFWRYLGRYLPSRGSALPAPLAVLAGAGAGSCDNGAHSVYATYVDTNGVESAPSAGTVVTVTDKTTNGKITCPLTGPVPGNASTWNVYMSKNGTTTPKYLVTSGLSLLSPSYTINVADTGLTVAMTTAAITFAEAS